MEMFSVSEKIGKDDFKWLQAWLYDCSAIVLEDARKFFAEKRLLHVLAHLKLPDFKVLFAQLRSDPDTALGAEVLEALTQSETWFFRDMPLFEHLRDQLIPKLRARTGGRKVRVWSAACSTGQEPYSLAMALAAKDGPDWHRTVQIDASDLSVRQIAHAKDGAYHRDDVNRGLPSSMLAKHFTQLGTRWHIQEEFREAVSFEALRLDRPWPVREAYDLILLRNVLFYFDEATRAEVLWRVRKQLRPDGILVLGAAENNELEEGFIKQDQGRFWTYERCNLNSGPVSLSFQTQAA